MSCPPRLPAVHTVNMLRGSLSLQHAVLAGQDMHDRSQSTSEMTSGSLLLSADLCMCTV